MTWFIKDINVKNSMLLAQYIHGFYIQLYITDNFKYQGCTEYVWTFSLSL